MMLQAPQIPKPPSEELVTRTLYDLWNVAPFITTGILLLGLLVVVLGAGVWWFGRPIRDEVAWLRGMIERLLERHRDP